MDTTLLQQAQTMRTLGINTYPLASVALVSILAALNVSDLGPGFAANKSPVEQWAYVHIARMQWAVERLADVDETPAPMPYNAPAPGINASILLECWLGQNPAQRMPAFINAAVAMACGGPAHGVTADWLAETLGIGPRLASLFYLEFADFIAEDIDVEDLRRM